MPEWAYGAADRQQIMLCIKRLNVEEGNTMVRISFDDPAVRRAVRQWYYDRWLYLLEEYEKVLPPR